ncbi:MAG: hypothetical protein ACRC8G_08930 [Plesiomonas shigelloides]
MGWVAAAATAVGALASSSASKKAAKSQAQAAESGQRISQEQFEAIQKNLSPFVEFGTSQLPSLQGVMQPLNRQDELAQYYGSPEFNMMSRQARGQQLAASEATGGLGSSSTSNALAAIAPQLGMNYLGQREAQQADLFNRLMSGTEIGLNAAAMTGRAGQQYASQAANEYNQAGAAKAGGQLAMGNLIGNIAGAVGGYYGNKF